MPNNKRSDYAGVPLLVGICRRQPLASETGMSVLERVEGDDDVDEVDDDEV